MKQCIFNFVIFLKIIHALWFSDSKDEYLDEDPTQQSATIQLPSDECIGCGVSTKSCTCFPMKKKYFLTSMICNMIDWTTFFLHQIRLVRQAAEWGPRYLFWSCADVDIVNSDTIDCGDHGSYDAQSGSCKCESGR